MWILTSSLYNSETDSFPTCFLGLFSNPKKAQVFADYYLDRIGIEIEIDWIYDNGDYSEYSNSGNVVKYPQAYDFDFDPALVISQTEEIWSLRIEYAEVDPQPEITITQE